MTLSSKTIAVKGRTVEVLEDGAGPALVFLHGGGIVEGADFLEALADRYHVVVPLLPGYGATELEPLLTSRQEVADHLADVLDALGLERVILVGHSLGGWRAAAFTASYPERVSRLVLASPAGMNVEGHPMTAMLAHTPEERLEILTYDATVWEGRIPTAPDADFAAKRAKEHQSMAAFGPGPFDATLPPLVQSIKTETLLLWGEADRLIPVEHAEAWSAALPHATVRTFPGAGHLLFHERPEAVEAIASPDAVEGE